MPKKKVEIKYKCCYNCQHRMLVSGYNAHKFNKIDCVCGEKWYLPIKRNIFKIRWCTNFVPVENNNLRVTRKEAEKRYIKIKEEVI